MEFLNLKDEEIQKMTKSNLVEFFKKLRDFSNESLNNFMLEMKNVINEMKGNMERLSQENRELKKLVQGKENERLKSNEITTNDTAQYIRRNNIEISGIPDIFTNNLEEKVIEVCNLYGVEVKADDIEACHRLPKGRKQQKLPASTIVRFVNRKKVEMLKMKRKDEVNLERIGFPKGMKIFFNDNLCPYYRNLWYKCRHLKQAGLVKYVWTSNGIVKVRRDENSPALKIVHNDDLSDHFPDFNFE